MHPKITLKLSIRLPPTKDPKEVGAFVKNELERDPPYNAKINVNGLICNPGWSSKPYKKSFDKIIDSCS